MRGRGTKKNEMENWVQVKNLQTSATFERREKLGIIWNELILEVSLSRPLLHICITDDEHVRSSS